MIKNYYLVSYYFFNRLRPWVHYVPLSYSMAELPSIVEHLLKHENVAKRLASNSRAFGESYLRLEDYLCHSAAILEGFGNALKDSDILQPFNATKIPSNYFSGL